MRHSKDIPVKKPAAILIPIDEHLRFVLFGLECVADVSFDGRECERIFEDAKNDQVSARDYMLHESSKVRVTARVDEYEPESVLLCVDGGGVTDTQLEHVHTLATYHVHRLRAGHRTS